MGSEAASLPAAGQQRTQATIQHNRFHVHNNVALINSNSAHWSSINRLLTVGEFVSVRDAVNSYPLDLTDDQKFLVYAAGLAGAIDIKDMHDPLRTLSKLPPKILKLVSYTFAIATVDYSILSVLPNPVTNDIGGKYGNTGLLIITSGTLAEWRDVLDTHLSGHWALGTGDENILKTIKALLENRGLKVIFQKDTSNGMRIA